MSAAGLDQVGDRGGDRGVDEAGVDRFAGCVKCELGQPVTAWRVVESIVLLALRVSLGLLVFYAGWQKLFGAGVVPQDFAFSIKAYKVIDVSTHGYLITLGTFVVPWTEMIAGAMLTLGLWGRGSALVATVWLIGFAWLNQRAIDLGLQLNCSCFGKMKLICEGPIHYCHVWRNIVMALVGSLVVWRGPGMVSLDTFGRMFRRAQYRH